MRPGDIEVLAQPVRRLLQGAVVFVLSAFCGTGWSQTETLTISPLFSSYGVLQRNEPIRFWGKCDPGERVVVSFAGKRTESLGDRSGRWSAEFEAMQAGGPYSLSVSGSSTEAESKDLLVGDVWLCSGQSNMGFRLEHSLRATEFTDQAGNEQLRLMQMNRRTSAETLDAPDTRGWRPDRDSYARAFSAVGYHFGRILQSETGVPIGLIEATWGGTPAEAWTPEPTLRLGMPWSAPLLAEIPKYDLSEEEIQSRVAEYEAVHAAYIANLLADEAGERLGWAAPDFDDSMWDSIEAPGFWEPTIGSVDGVVWLRRDIELTQDDLAAAAVIELGMVEEYDDTYINGTRIGGLTYPSRGAGRKPRVYPVPAGVLREGVNTIAVRAVDTRTAGGFGSNAEAMQFRVGDRSLSLAGAWKIKVSHDAALDGGFPLEGTRVVTAARQQRRPSALYNGMIHQLTPLPIRGVIWYQGESNNGRADQYAKLFPVMIESWRDAWVESDRIGEMPFLFVQLPNYRARSDSPEESGWAELREAQEAALQLPATGMAVTIDVGAADDIHPRNKLPVGERLAAICLADVYGRPDPVAQSPSIHSHDLANGRVRIHFSHAAGLHTLDGAPPRSFAIAGDDGLFRWAQARIAGESVEVWHDEVQDPTEVRYAWAWNPDVNTANSGGRPVAPFRLRLQNASGETQLAE